MGPAQVTGLTGGYDCGQDPRQPYRRAIAMLCQSGWASRSGDGSKRGKTKQDGIAALAAAVQRRRFLAMPLSGRARRQKEKTKKRASADSRRPPMFVRFLIGGR